MADNSQFSQHISRQFNEELEDVRQQVLAMGGLVEEQLNDALNALIEHDGKQAQKVIEGDVKVNGFEVSIDEECARILAKRQPAAGDLRLLVAIIKTITDLERVGDEAEKIAKMASHLSFEVNNDAQPTKKHFGAVMHMGQHVMIMLRHALDAFARLDVQEALKVAKQEVIADREYDAISRQLITYIMEDPRAISGGLDVLWAARSLERIGDHAKNISEYVIYLVCGKDVRHISINELEQVTKADKS
ncbi:MAG: phosphate signaling complex protein PhoU [Pseudomonadota bacterium]